MAINLPASERFICVHGHFYQPPRENPWLEAIELQDSAYPYHDWNERITAECYEPNSESRIQDDKGYIRAIVNNYGRISFNFGPTLISWMRDHSPETLAAIVRADHESRERFGGHGNAVAQCYNHIIMPLANSRDKRTQVEWGVRDFEQTFGRPPEGMWLPEAAVDLETLDLLAEYGVRFTILAPRQAGRIRKMPAAHGHWKDVSGGGVDPSVAYLHKLPSGRSIAVFFYDGPISQAVAFEGLLANGALFARRLQSGFSAERTGPQLVSIATDGESYGHHHRFGDMALAFALDSIERDGAARLTNYAQFLELHPPTWQVEIIENSSWSCIHGVERWRGDCGCGTGAPGMTHQWRGPLRIALDGLRDAVMPKYEAAASELLRDPWAARNAYIAVVLDRSPEAFEKFLDAHALRALTGAERITVRRLLEMQRNAMLMFTSCGWFFDEVSGIEGVQILRYAARVMQLSEQVFGASQETIFLKRLALARSNLPEYRDGATVYERTVRPSVVDLCKVGAHYAVLSAFEECQSDARIYEFDVGREDATQFESGSVRLIVGRARVTSRIIGDSVRLAYAVLHTGEHELRAAVRELSGHENHESFLSELGECVSRGDLKAAGELARRYFNGMTYDIHSLFSDERRRILDVILSATVAELMDSYRRMYEKHAALMGFLTDLEVPVPEVLHKTAEFVVNANLRLAFEREDFDLPEAQTAFEDARRWHLNLDTAGLAYGLTSQLDKRAGHAVAEPGDLANLRRFDALAAFVRGMPFAVSLIHAQNAVYALRESEYPAAVLRAAAGDEVATAWSETFRHLAERLMIRVERD